MSLSRPVVSVERVDATSATLEWGAVAGATAYRVAYAMAASPKSLLGSLTVTAIRVDIVGLSPDTDYVATVQSAHRSIQSSPYTVKFTTHGLDIASLIPCDGSILCPRTTSLAVEGTYQLSLTSVGWANTEGGGIVINGRDEGDDAGQPYLFGCFHAGRITSPTVRCSLQLRTPLGDWRLHASGWLRNTTLHILVVPDDGGVVWPWLDANAPWISCGYDEKHGARCLRVTGTATLRHITFGGRVVGPAEVYARIGLPQGARALSGIDLC